MNKLTLLNRLGIKIAKVNGGVDIELKRLTSLKGCPKEVTESFWCGFNYLTSLEGAPKKVGGTFACSGNPFTSLKGIPKKIGGNFVNMNISEELIKTYGSVEEIKEWIKKNCDIDEDKIMLEEDGITLS